QSTDRSDVRRARPAGAPRLMPRRATWHLLVPGLIVGAIIAAALVVPFLPLPDPIRMEISARLLPPSVSHLFGQDEYGRDVLSRIWGGARRSVVVRFLAAAAAPVVGTCLGLFGGYFRGLIELLPVRTPGALLCCPPLLLALLVVTLLGPGAGTL